MINIGAYSRTTVNLDFNQQSELKLPGLQPPLQVEKSSMICMLQAYLYELLQKTNKPPQEKKSCCRRLGATLGANICEVLSQNNAGKFILNKDPTSKSVKFQQEVKFLCETIWIELFAKKVDKLHYSHANTSFTLIDYQFKLVRNISHTDQELVAAFSLLNCELVCGIIEGVFSRFNHEVDVKFADKGQVEFDVRFKNTEGSSYFSTG